jgi:RNA polymerase sigma-70 factor (ECF subfamily)
MQPAPLDSPSLLERAQSGDAEAFWALCEPLEQRLIRQGLALCRDEELARDLAQETMIAAWKSIGRFNGACQLGTWLCSILFHKHQTALRRARWRTFFVSLAGTVPNRPAELVDAALTPDKALQVSERSRQILGALERLPSKQRETVFLRFYAGESLEGIAAVMKCSTGTVKSRLFHGLENLREMRIFKEEFR